MRVSPALQVENLSYAFGKNIALDRVSFSIAPGECMMLLGPNGAGKSTLFGVITHLLDAGEGWVSIKGYDLKKKSSNALKNLGVVFQQTTLDLDLSVLQNLRYHAALHGMARARAKRRIWAELERQNMLDRRKEKVRHLNGGHRRRVEIARALLHNPSILLLDEPTVGLDVPSRQGIVKYIHELSRSQGIAVMWATHLIDEVYDTDHLVVLHKSKIRAQGTVNEVINASKSESVAGAFDILTDGSQFN